MPSVAAEVQGDEAGSTTGVQVTFADATLFRGRSIMGMGTDDLENLVGFGPQVPCVKKDCNGPGSHYGD